MTWLMAIPTHSYLYHCIIMSCPFITPEFRRRDCLPIRSSEILEFVTIARTFLLFCSCFLLNSTPTLFQYHFTMVKAFFPFSHIQIKTSLLEKRVGGMGIETRGGEGVQPHHMRILSGTCLPPSYHFSDSTVFCFLVVFFA